MAISCSYTSAQSFHPKIPIFQTINAPNSHSPMLISFPQNPKHSPSPHLPPNNSFSIILFKFRRRKTGIQPSSTPNPEFSAPDLITKSLNTSSNKKLIVICSAITIVLAIANRVLYKLALVPMKDYPFFLAQVNTFGYVAIYASILYIRNRSGIVTDEMMAIPKFRFVIIGFLEALGVVAGMSSAGCRYVPASRIF